ncbi:MAG: CapA family protein [Clostridia bacterium]|nr:CapA family protein [Clostridia bacterium]
MSNKKTSIIFSGDIGFDKYMDKRWEDEKLLSKSLIDFFHTSDHVCLNVEGAICDLEEDGTRGAYFHAMNPAAIEVFNKIGADVWSIGNNHIMDAGESGVVSTLYYAEKNNVKTIGAGLNEEEASAPVYFDGAGGIGVFCTTYMPEKVPATSTTAGFFRWDDFELIKRRIDEVKAKCRWCVIVCHGGEEFNPMPSAYTRERFIRYLELGADAVVAHHPHVPESYELFENGKMIFYSLGNFIFDTNYQRAHLYTDVGVLLKLVFDEDKLDFEAVGTKLCREEERIDLAPLPDIFTNIEETEYNTLLPLAAKAFVAEEKRRKIFLYPDRFSDATEDEWKKYFLSEEPSGFCKDAHMDFYTVYSEALKAEDGEWKSSKLEKVKEYILKLV